MAWRKRILICAKKNWKEFISGKVGFNTETYQKLTKFDESTYDFNRHWT